MASRSFLSPTSSPRKVDVKGLSSVNSFGLFSGIGVKF